MPPMHLLSPYHSFCKYLYMLFFKKVIYQKGYYIYSLDIDTFSIFVFNSEYDDTFAFLVIPL